MQLKNKDSNFKSRLFEQIYHTHEQYTLKYEIAKKRGEKKMKKIIHFFIF